MYGIGHVLSKIVFHETPKSSMAQCFRADYMIKLDTTFKFHETKFHRVVWALFLAVNCCVCHASLSKLFTNINASAMTLYPGFLLIKCQVVIEIWGKVS